MIPNDGRDLWTTQCNLPFAVSSSRPGKVLIPADFQREVTNVLSHQIYWAPHQQLIVPETNSKHTGSSQTTAKYSISWESLQKYYSEAERTDSSSVVWLVAYHLMDTMPLTTSRRTNILHLAKVPSRFFNDIHIWQVSLQLNCGDTCEILMFYSLSNMYFDNAENFRK